MSVTSGNPGFFKTSAGRGSTRRDRGRGEEESTKVGVRARVDDTRQRHTCDLPLLEAGQLPFLPLCSER